MRLQNELNQPYQDLVKSYEKFMKARENYILSTLPRYVSVPRFFSELGLKPSYQEMKQLAVLAETKSRDQFMMVKVDTTEIGHLFCYRQEVLDQAFEELNPKFD